VELLQLLFSYLTVTLHPLLKARRHVAAAMQML